MNRPQENLKPLKTLVFSMGIVLMGGMVLLVGLAWSKFRGLKNISAPEICQPVTVSLKAYGKLTDEQAEGGVLQLRFIDADHRIRHLTVDSCSGRLLTDITLEPLS